MDRVPGVWVRRIAVAIAGPAAVTLLALPEFHPPTTLVALLYVLTVVIASRVGGAIAGAGASIVSFLALNFFFSHPLHTFAVEAPEDVAGLVVFLMISLLVGLLFSSAVAAKEQAERREQEARLLNRLATQLLTGNKNEEAIATFASGMCDVFRLARCRVTTTFELDADVVRSETRTEPRLFPLRARQRDIGEMTVWVAETDRLSDDDEMVISSVATQLALALEGTRLSVEVRKAELEVQASQLKAALFSGVTHDVKTPLAAIMAAVTSLIEGRGFPEHTWHEHLETIKEEAERLHRVVNNLLDVARLRAGALVAQKSPSAIDELVESVLNRLRPLLKDHAVEMRVGEEVPEVPIDVIQIDQVLTNLIENAIKFSPPGSPVSLIVVGHIHGIRVTVADRGPGVPKEDRDRIFEPFERGDDVSSGTGLGLAISKAIVTAHGGRMWVADNPAGGAAFTFELPASDPPEPKEVSDVGAGARG